MISEFLRLSLISLRHQKVRSWLTIIGIVIGIASIIALISISQGLENAIVEQFSKLGVNDLRVTPKGLRGPPTVGLSTLTTKDVETVEKVKGVDYVLGVIMKLTGVEYGQEEKFLSVVAYPTGLAAKAFLDVDIKVEDGRVFSKGEKGIALLGSKIAKDSFKREIKPRNSIMVDGKQFKVIGVFKEVGLPMIDSGVFIPVDDARELFGLPDQVSAMTVHLEPGMDMVKVSKDIEKALKRSRGDENFEVFTPTQALEQLKSILGVVSIVLAGIAAISLLVGGIGIMNSMYTSVLERTRDIGVMKAVGATNRSVLMMFLLESGMIGVAGGIVGVGIGTAMAFGFGEVAKQLGFSLLSIRIEWGLIFFALAFSFVVGLVSGTMPAYRASRLNPVDALRYE